MSSHDFLIACRKCRKESPMREMKYADNGKDLICSACALQKEDNTGNYEEEEDYIPATKTMQQKQQPVPAEKDTKMKYYCISCSYIFLRNQDVPVTACPYCSKATIRKFTAKSTDDLIKESDDVFS